MCFFAKITNKIEKSLTFGFSKNKIISYDKRETDAISLAEQAF